MKALKKLLMLFVALFMIAGCDTPEQNDSSSGDISGNYLESKLIVHHIKI